MPTARVCRVTNRDGASPSSDADTASEGCALTSPACEAICWVFDPKRHDGTLHVTGRGTNFATPEVATRTGRARDANGEGAQVFRIQARSL